MESRWDSADAVLDARYAQTPWVAAALVIAPIEEFFWRGFIYRWMQGAAFQRRDLGQFHGPMFAVVAVVFGLEHAEWAAGTPTGSGKPPCLLPAPLLECAA